MSRRKESTFWFIFHFLVISCIVFLGAVAVIGVILTMLSFGQAQASESGVVLDEPMIVTESQGTVTGVWGDEAVNLNTYRGRRGGQTFGTVGDRVILVDHSRRRLQESRYEQQAKPFGTLPSHRRRSLEEVSDLQPEEE